MPKKKENTEVTEERQIGREEDGYKILSPDAVDTVIKDYLKSIKRANGLCRAFSSPAANRAIYYANMTIIDYLSQGLPKRNVLQQIMDRWGITHMTANKWFNRGVEWMKREDERFEDEIKDRVKATLEQMIQDAIEDVDRGNALKAIDMINKMYGNYAAEKKEVDLKSDEPIKIVLDGD